MTATKKFLTPQPMRVEIAEAGAVSGLVPVPVPLHVVNITPGTAAPSEVVMTDASGNVNFPAGTAIKVGGSTLAAAGVSTATTATTGELNALHSQGCIAADFAKLHALTATAAAIDAAAAGTPVVQQTHASAVAMRTDTVAHLQSDLVALLIAAGIVAAS